MDVKSKANLINSAASVNELICNNCGTANKSKSKFCINCGTPLTKPVIKTQEPEEPAANAVFAETSVEETEAFVSADEEPATGAVFAETSAEETEVFASADEEPATGAVFEETSAEETEVFVSVDEEPVTGAVFAETSAEETEVFVSADEEAGDVLVEIAEAASADKKTDSEENDEPFLFMPSYDNEEDELPKPKPSIKKSNVKDKAAEKKAEIPSHKEEKNIFAEGLPEWDLIPPQVVVRKR